MQNIYTTLAKGMDNEETKRATHRLLKRLRIALFIWLISLIATIIWFSYTR